MAEFEDYYVQPEKPKTQVNKFAEGDISPTVIEELNTTSNHYVEGFSNSNEAFLDCITELYKEISKIDPSNDLEANEKAGEGLETLLGGTILKQIIKYDSTESDSGYRKQIYIRWDLLCQILNRLCIPTYKKNTPVSELTYLNPNRLTYVEGKEKQLAPDNTFYLNYAIPEQLKVLDRNINSVPLKGQSLDSSVCLMPHQPIFDRLFKQGSTLYDPDSSNFNDPDPEPEQDKYYPGISKSNNKNKRTKEDVVQGNFQNFTSFSNVTSDRNSIGLVYFNLDHVLEEYEDMRLESIDEGSGRFRNRLKKDFDVFEFVKKIWEDVNDACGGYYDFKLHTEHERPHVARIIDFTFSGDVDENKIYTFNPQGLNSISRDFNFQSSISNDFSSIISIAAQSPGNIHSLNAMSFKAFHKNVKNRFTSNEDEERGRQADLDFARRQLIRDVKRHKELKTSLNYYLFKLNKGNFETDTSAKNRPLISSNTAKIYLEELEELSNSLSVRHPLFNNENQSNDGKENRPNAGTYRENTTLERNAIIPLEFNIRLDGISGLIPLQLFKIQSDRLPLGYANRDDIVFIVKGESHTITSGQDWTVDINGQLTLLNNNINKDGYNEIASEGFNQNEGDIIDNEDILINPTLDQTYDIKVSSSWPRRNDNKNWHLGIDLALPSNTPLVAVGNGTISKRFQNARDENRTPITEEVNPFGTGYGRYIILTLDNEDKPTKTKKILYGHVSTWDYFEDGATVKKGDIIALSGGGPNDIGKGSSDGAHLHYEVGTNLAFTNEYFLKRANETSNGRRQRIFYQGRIALATDFQQFAEPTAGKNIAVAEELQDNVAVLNPLKILEYPNGIGTYGEILYGPDYNEPDGANTFEENAESTGPQQAPVATDNF